MKRKTPLRSAIKLIMNTRIISDMWKRILILCGIVFWSCSEKIDNNDNKWYIPTEYLREYDMEQRMDIYNAWREAGGMTFDGLPDSIKYVQLISPDFNIVDILTEETNSAIAGADGVSEDTIKKIVEKYGGKIDEENDIIKVRL